MPGLLQTLAIMNFHSSRLPVLRMSLFIDDYFPVVKLFRLSVNLIHCLPLLLTPLIFPQRSCFSSLSALFRCPKNSNCLFLMVVNKVLLYPDMYITSSLDFFSIHDIFSVLLMFFSSRPLRVFFSDPLLVSSNHNRTEELTIHMP